MALIQCALGAALFLSYHASRQPSVALNFVIQMTEGRVADLGGPESLYSVEAQQVRQREILRAYRAGTGILPFTPPFYRADAHPLVPRSDAGRLLSLDIWLRAYSSARKQTTESDA